MSTSAASDGAKTPAKDGDGSTVDSIHETVPSEEEKKIHVVDEDEVEDATAIHETVPSEEEMPIYVEFVDEDEVEDATATVADTTMETNTAATPLFPAQFESVTEQAASPIETEKKKKIKKAHWSVSQGPTKDANVDSSTESITSVGLDEAKMPKMADDDISRASLHGKVPGRWGSDHYYCPDKEFDVIRVGTFKINGVKKSFAVVPPNLIHSQPDMEDLISYWGLPGPNFILQTNESNEHRERIISMENASCILHNIFQPGEAETTYPQEKGNDVDVEGGDPGMSWLREEAPWLEELKQKQTLKWKKLSTDDWMFANKYLERKTIQALSSIVSAADMTKGWFLCHGPPSSNEKMLEIAIDSTGSKPTVLVVDDLEIYARQWEEGTPTKALLKRLAKAGTPLNLKAEEETIEFEVFDNYDMQFRRGSQTSFSIPGGRSQRSLDVSNEPENSLWDRTTTGEWTPRLPWMRGTHYIFSSNMECFEPSLLGPAGYLCMNGHVGANVSQQPKRTGHMIREAMLAVRTCILFNNTGAETQMYARLIDEVQRVGLARQKIEQIARLAKPVTFFGGGIQKKILSEIKDSISEYYSQRKVGVDGLFDISQNKTKNANESTSETYSDLKIFLRQNAWKLWEHAIQGYAGKGDKAEVSGSLGILTLADVVQIVDLYCDNPRLFQKIVVTVNPLNDTPDSIVKAMTLSFARSVMEAREVGAGDADKKAVVQSWRFHFQLDKTKRIKNIWRAVLYTLYIYAGFATTLVAVVSGTGSPYKDAIPWIAMSLAAVVSLCSAILSLISADSHINKIEIAQAKIESEILRFRMRVGKYSVSARERSEDDETNNRTKPSAREETIADRRAGAQSHNLSKEMHDCRNRFSRSMEIITQDLSSVDLYYHKSAQHTEEAKESSTEFKEYVQSQLHLNSFKDKRNEVAISGIMTPEDYYKLRLLPLLDYVEKQEDRLRLITRSLQIGSMMCSSAAIILGAAEEVEYIPAVIAGATGLFQILKVTDVDRRFDTASAAARELRGLNSHWDSLSDLDHQMRDSIVRMVRTCEQLALQFATTSAIQVDKAEIGMKDESAQEAPAFGKRKG